MTVPVIEVKERLLRVTDAFGRLLDPQTGRQKMGYPGYASPSRRVIWDVGSSGIVVKRPHSEESGRKALKGHGHWRLVEIRNDLQIGDHCS